jgi:nickel-type superoxide dismutase maturation protease
MIAGLIALAGAALAWPIWRRFGIGIDRYAVAGPSMEPALRDGDRLLLLTGIHRLRRPRPGEVVVAQVGHGPGRTVVKRVAAVYATGAGWRVHLLGDNPDASTDSRNFGDVGVAALTGLAVYRYWPAERRGRLSRAAD